MKLFNSIERFLQRLPIWSIAAAVAVILAAIGFLDYITGEEIGFSIFYVIPVLIAVWYLGRIAGIITSTAAAAVWYIADIGTGHTYSSAVIPLWNAVVRLSFFLLISVLLDIIRSVLEHEQGMARTDSLTGVLNARQFYESAGGEIERARRYGRPLSVAYMDLDNFKEVNDVYGHSIGDDLLRYVATAMKENVRVSDVIARMGGDEFIVLLPETDDAVAVKSIERLCALIRRGMSENRFPVTLSVGLITYIVPPPSVEEMVHEVDTLMYYVKNGGKNALSHIVVERDEDREKIAELRPERDSIGDVAAASRE